MAAVEGLELESLCMHHASYFSIPNRQCALLGRCLPNLFANAPQGGRHPSSAPCLHECVYLLCAAHMHAEFGYTIKFNHFTPDLREKSALRNS